LIGSYAEALRYLRAIGQTTRRRPAPKAATAPSLP
jgi:hypothetical protein